MRRNERSSIIKQIEELRDSKVIVYFTGDRRGPISSSIAEDAVRYLFDHLLAIQASGNLKPIDLFLYSRGGDVSVPWRIVSMIREFCDRFSVLIPYKAHSAATMIVLGADSVVMGKKAELGPIDPTLTRAAAAGSATPPQEISVEDVTAYISFMRDRANINDQNALSTVISQLADHLTPLTIGSVNRQYSHIRIVARKLLGSRIDKMDEEKINTITETLTEKIYSHGHAIGRVEAVELGLPIEKENPELEKLLWDLYLEYESQLSLNRPLDPVEILNTETNDEKHLKNVPLAVIESAEQAHVFETDIVVRNVRNTPANPHVSINLNAAFPPNINPAEIPESIQTIMQHILNQLMPPITKQVNDEIVKQSPIVGCEVKSFGGNWRSVV